MQLVTKRTMGPPIIRSAGLLTFAELEAPSCFFTTGFLTFDRSGIATQQTGSLEGGTEFRIHFQQGPGNSKLGRFGLAFHPSACSVDLDIIFVSEFNRF